LARKDKASNQPAASTEAAGRQISLEQAMAMAYEHWHAGQAAAAERLCQQVLAASPNHADALHLLGLMAHAYGNAELGIELLTKACAVRAVPALFHSNLAEMCRQRGRLSEAEAAGRRAVAADPSLSQAWNNLGIVLQERGNLEESLDCIRKALQLRPAYAEGHNNLGNTLKKLGRLEDAAHAYRKALSINPNAADAHGNFSATLCNLGQFDEARTHAKRAIEINPRASDAYANLAMVETKLGRHPEALALIEAALSFAPENIRLLLAQADLLKTLDRLDEGLIVSARAVALAPEDGDALNIHAMLLQTAGRYAEAIAGFDRAAQIMPQPASAIANKALALMETGRRDEAMAAFEEALGRQPTLASTWFNRADAKKFTPDDPDIRAMEELLTSGAAQSYEDRMCLHFALGKAYLDANRTGPAFTHLGEGNRMKRATLSYDAGSTERWIASIIETFPAERFRRFAGAGMRSAVPVFVLGMPRSGTTLVEQVLAAHPQIHGAGELGIVQRLVNRVYGPDRTAQPYPGFIDLFGPAEFAAFGQQYLAQVTRLAPGTPRIIDKMPANFLYAGLIHLALPDARIIHCRRDPLDTCLSCYSKLFSAEQAFAYDLKELGQFYRSYRRLTDHWKQVLPGSAFTEIDYADMVGDLETSARRLIDFLGLAWDDACLDFHRSSRPVKTASMNQVRQPIYKSSLGRAKSYRKHLAPLIDALGPVA
jgi:tetratricopeptide (TPR) repeat protein